MCRGVAGSGSVALWGSWWVWLSRCLPPVGWLSNEALNSLGFLLAVWLETGVAPRSLSGVPTVCHLPTPEPEEVCDVGDDWYRPPQRVACSGRG